MASGFSANQYEDAFKSHKLQNWTVPKHFKERPTAADGHTTFIATDRGHLLPGMKSKRGCTTTFVGTWDLPNRIPPAKINPTARSLEGQKRLKGWEQAPQRISKGGIDEGLQKPTCMSSSKSAVGQTAENTVPAHTVETPTGPLEVEAICEPPSHPESSPLMLEL